MDVTDRSIDGRQNTESTPREAALLERLRRAEREARDARVELEATRRKADEAIKALAESEKRYRLMGETIPFGVWWCNPEGEAEYVSPSFCELLDMTLEEQNKFGWTQRLVPEDVEPMLRHWRFCCETGTAWDYEHRVIDRNRQIHTVLSRGLPVRDETTGAIQAWVGVNLDITARKRIETELKDAKRALEQALRVKDEFLANISHELRTPLTLILGPVRALAGSANLHDEQRHDLAVVERNARTLLRTVNDLLELSKVDAGRTQAQYCDFDLAWLARWVASHFEVVGDDRHIVFAVDMPERIPCQADPEKLQRVLFNLLSNAFKFTPAGGQVLLRVRPTGEVAELVVEDSGPGVPQELRNAVFERFRQVDASATRQFGGTGLGLAIVKEFVELHRGSVEVGGRSTGGARFVARLPLRAPPGAVVHPLGELSEDLAETAVADLRGQARPLVDACDAASSGTVLVVEDNPEMNAFLTRALAKQHRVLSAFDGKDGLQKAELYRPDLIVTDLMMPVLSGEQMIRSIRALPELNEIRILVLTAKVDDQIRVEQLRGGAQDVLVKPFVAEELLARAAGLIESKRRAEAQVRESHALLKAVTQGVSDAIFVKDLEGRYRMANTAAIRRLGKNSEREVLGHDDMSILEPEDAARVVAADRQAIASEGGITYEEQRESGGERRHFLTSKAPHRDAAGRVVGVLGIARDVTDLKHTELELRRLQAELERRVELRTEELAAVNRELEAFVYTASHDLQAPLRQINAFTELLGRRAKDTLDPRSRGYLTDIANASVRMGALIADLLTLSRVGRAPLCERPVDLRSLAQDVWNELKLQANGRTLEVTVGELPVVKGDPTLLRSALLNFLSNALKYTRPRAPSKVEVGVAREQNELVVFVRDNGVGFDPRFRDRLFGLFQRLHTVDQFEGTGVGLACVKRAVERHGGRVWADGEIDRGATFYFSLPLNRLRDEGRHGLGGRSTP